MALRKEIGKIKSVRYGYGGYQDAMFGVYFDLGSKGWGVGDFWGTWAHRSEGCKWSTDDQAKLFAELTQKLIKLMDDAEVTSIEDLVGTPVEVSFETMTLKDWRVLKEAV